MNCIKCNSTVSKDDNYCRKCGFPIKLNGILSKIQRIYKMVNDDSYCSIKECKFGNNKHYKILVGKNENSCNIPVTEIEEFEINDLVNCMYCDKPCCEYEYSENLMLVFSFFNEKCRIKQMNNGSVN